MNMYFLYQLRIAAMDRNVIRLPKPTNFLKETCENLIKLKLAAGKKNFLREMCENLIKVKLASGKNFLREMCENLIKVKLASSKNFLSEMCENLIKLKLAAGKMSSRDFGVCQAQNLTGSFRHRVANFNKNL